MVFKEQHDILCPSVMDALTEKMWEEKANLYLEYIQCEDNFSLHDGRRMTSLTYHQESGWFPWKETVVDSSTGLCYKDCHSATVVARLVW